MFSPVKVEEVIQLIESALAKTLSLNKQHAVNYDESAQGGARSDDRLLAVYEDLAW